MNTINKRSELLLPAGNLDKVKTAILYGADAVYIGTPDLSLRTKASFTLAEVIEATEFVKKHNKRLYLTLNLFSHNSDMEKLPSMIEVLNRVQPHGVIVADPGIFAYLKKYAPSVPLHISTQANVCSWMSAQYWADQGAELCVLAREVSFEEAKEIKEKCPNLKIETFIHGAMCMTYSGRCLLSNYMAERGANQGNCAHSCRWGYKVHLKLKEGKELDLLLNDETKELFEFYLKEEFRADEFYPIHEDERGSYILNSKDLCLMPVLNQYLEAGIDSLKIEGRHKTEYYVAIAARAYRKAIDDYYANKETWTPDPYMQELYTLQNRGFSMAFHSGKLTNIAHNYDTTQTMGTHVFAGIVKAHTAEGMEMELKNFLTEGDILEFLSPHQWEPIALRMYQFTDKETGQAKEKASPGKKGQAIYIPWEAFHTIDIVKAKESMPIGTVVRRKVLNDISAQEAIRIDKVALNVERGLSTYEFLEDRKQQRGKSNQEPKKAPKTGLAGCCGKACNGCLHFWYDEKYTKKREEKLLQLRQTLPIIVHK